MNFFLSQGADEFYKGEIAELLVKDIQDAGGIITTQDMANYRSATFSATQG